MSPLDIRNLRRRCIGISVGLIGCATSVASRRSPSLHTRSATPSAAEERSMKRDRKRLSRNGQSLSNTPSTTLRQVDHVSEVDLEADLRAYLRAIVAVVVSANA